MNVVTMKQLMKKNKLMSKMKNIMKKVTLNTNQFISNIALSIVPILMM